MCYMPLDNRFCKIERRGRRGRKSSQIRAERPAPYARCRCWAKKRRVSSTSKSLCTLCTALGDMGRSQRNSRPPKMVTEATFDVDARKDWLQGFRKRKRERRPTGLAHGALKARKQKLADRAARRSMRPPPAPEPVVLDEAPATRETVVLTDSNVVEQWGAAMGQEFYGAPAHPVYSAREASRCFYASTTSQDAPAYRFQGNRAAQARARTCCWARR